MSRIFNIIIYFIHLQENEKYFLLRLRMMSDYGMMHQRGYFYGETFSTDDEQSREGYWFCGLCVWYGLLLLCAVPASAVYASDDEVVGVVVD